MEYLARTRQEIIETFDWLRLAENDVITVSMRYLDNCEFMGIEEASPESVASDQGYEVAQIEG